MRQKKNPRKQSKNYTHENEKEQRKKKKRTKMKQITEETRKNKITSAQLRYLKITNQITNQNVWDLSKTTLRGNTEDLHLLVCKERKKKGVCPSQAACHRGRPAALGKEGIPSGGGSLPVPMRSAGCSNLRPGEDPSSDSRGEFLRLFFGVPGFFRPL